MPTTKTVKIQNNKILTYSITKAGFKQIVKSVEVNGDATISEVMVSQTSDDAPYEVSDVLLGVAKFVDYFTPTGSQTFTKNGVTISAADYGLKKAGIIKASSALGAVSFLEFGEYIFVNKAGTAQDNTVHDYTLTFTADGWVLTEGETTIATDTLENFGLSTQVTGAYSNTIQLKAAYYNKFAVFAITDTNFKANKYWATNSSTDTDLPNGLNQGYSATWANALLLGGYNFFGTGTAFGYLSDKGIFVLPNNMQIKAVVPNDVELKAIYDIRDALGISWSNYGNSNVWCCAESSSNVAYYLTSNGNFNYYSKNNVSCGVIGVFEVPVF